FLNDIPRFSYARLENGSQEFSLPRSGLTTFSSARGRRADVSCTPSKGSQTPANLFSPVECYRLAGLLPRHGLQKHSIHRKRRLPALKMPSIQLWCQGSTHHRPQELRRTTPRCYCQRRELYARYSEPNGLRRATNSFGEHWIMANQQDVRPYGV